MVDSDEPEEISVTELRDRLAQGDDLPLLDVREAFELEICRLKYVLHIPMAELRFKLDQLEPYREKELIVYCRTGRRSSMAVMFLRDVGFTRAKNLAGGVHAWSDHVDSSFTKY